MKKILLILMFLFSTVAAFSQILFTVEDISAIEKQTFRGVGQSILCLENTSIYVVTETPSGAANGSTIIQILGTTKFAEVEVNLSSGGGSSNQVQVDAIQTALGIVNGAINFGSFTGSTLSDNENAKVLFQELETAVENVSGGTDYQVADLTALANSSYPVGTLVTVQSNGAVYKIESSNTSPFTTSTNLVIQDANSNFAIYQPTQNGYDLKQLGLVSDWDFDGNTGTDNGSTFNSLIEEITTKGYTAYIPEGDYGISTSSGFIESDRLEFADGGAIIGAGSNLTKLYVPHTQNFMFIGKSDDFTLKGFKIRPRETPSSGSLDAFRVQETNNLTIDDVFVEELNFINVLGSKTYSILPSKNIRILNSKSLNAVGNAFGINRAEGIEIAYTTIDNAASDLIKFSKYSFNIHIHNCKLLNGSDDYIDFFSGGTNAIIENNLFRGGGHTESKSQALGNCADNITYRNNTFDNVGINIDEASYRPLGNSRMLSASDGATITHNFNLPSFEFSNIELRAFDTNGDLVTSGFSTSSESANSFVFTNAANNVTHLLVSLPPSTHYAAVSRTEQIPSGSSTYTIERTGLEDFNFTLPQILLYEKSTRASVTNVSVSSEYTLSGDSLTFTFPSPTVTDYIMVVQIGMDGIDNLIIENNDFINMVEKAFASNGAISGRFSNNTINIIGDVVGITVPQVKGSFDIIGNSFIYQSGIDYSSSSYAITDNTYGEADSYFYGRLTIKNNYAENAPRFLNLDPTTNGGMYAENEWIIENNTIVNPEDGVSVQGLGEQIDQELVPSYQIRSNSLSYYRYSGNKIKSGSITQGTTTGSVQDQCLISVINGASAFALGEVVGKDGSGNWVKADNTTSIEAIGYVIRKFGSRMLVQTCGIVDDPDAGFTLGDVYYTGTNGATTTTKPANAQKIGTVISTSRLLLNIDATYSSSGYTVTDNTPQTLNLSRSLSMNDLSVAGETVIYREVNVDGAVNTSNNNSTVYRNSTILKTNAYTDKFFTNTSDALTINSGQAFDLAGKIVNYKNLLNDRSTVSTTNTIAADYTYQKDRTSGTASNGIALSATINAQNGTITNAKALDINVTEASGTNTNAIGIQINDVQGTNEYAIKQDGADDLNQFAGQVTIQNILNLQPILGANAPASPSEGDIIIVSDDATDPFTTAGMYLYSDSQWSKLLLNTDSYTFSSLQTSDFTVALGEYNLVDPNGGAITATVPSGITQVGTEFWVVDSEGTASGTNTITVDFSTNGYTVSGDNTAVINDAGDGFKFIYIGSNKWISERL